MQADPGVVIVGAGQAGFQVAVSLRDAGYDGDVVLVGDEPGLPYERPPLSKAFLKGDVGADALALRPGRFFADRRIEVLSGRRVVRILREERRAVLDDGRWLDYGHLVLATGARPRPLPVPGADLPGVHALRTLADAATLKQALAGARRMAVVGGGFIGLELAAVATGAGVETVVVEAAPRPLARAVSERTGSWFAQYHAQRGVELVLGAGVTAITGLDGRAAGVVTTTGREVPADLVVVGIGVAPADELAKGAGLETADGIVVDEQLTTSDPCISAIGDCAAFPSHPRQGRIRLESVQNATDQARTVAARVTGAPRPYDAVPWFWSDQGDVKLQIAGLSADHDKAVVRGDLDGAKFSVFCFRADQLIAVESVNRPADHVAARRLLGAGAELTPQQAVDPSFDLKAAAREASSLVSVP